MRALRAGCVALVLASGAITATSATAASAPRHVPATPYDFNGDGYVDAAIGAPGEDSDAQAAGAVHIVYGGLHGLTSKGFVIYGEGYDFGTAIASGDVNGDGYADLAIGNPGREEFWLYYGSSKGLTTQHNEVYDDSWDNGPTGSSSAPNQCCDRYGSSLAFGDFDNDGYADLAVGGPNIAVRQSATTVGNASQTVGAVIVHYGSADGLHRDQSFAPAVLEEWDAGNTGHSSNDDQGDFGASLTALPRATGGDDLVIGWPGRDAGGVIGAGAIEILTGTKQGLDGADSQLLSLNSPNVAGRPQSRMQEDEDCGPLPLFDEFGAAVVSGDFNGDGVADLAVGIPERQVTTPGTDIEGNTIYGAHGAVSILYGSTASFVSGSRLIHLNQRGVPGRASHEWYFGDALAAADVNGDGRDDLAIGAPGLNQSYSPSRLSHGGVVLVTPGSARGLRPARGMLLREGHHGVPGRDVVGDLFGVDLTFWLAGNHSGADLLIGAPGRTVHSARHAGAVVDVPNHGGQLDRSRSRLITGTTPGVQGSNSALNAFGRVDGTDYLDGQMYSGQPRQDEDSC